jgi:carbon monoxide dehydrogenase subunit G
MPLTFSMSHHFPAPPETVFHTMNDPEQFKHWMNNFVRCEVQTPEGEFGVGTKIAETRKFAGKEATEVFEITHYDPPRAISMHVDSRGSTTYDFDFRYEPEGGGTRVVMDAKIDGGGCMMKLLGGAMSGMFKKAIRKDWNALEAYIQSKQPS